MQFLRLKLRRSGAKPHGMRSLLLAVVTCSSLVVHAADIGGTISGNFVQLDQFGRPEVSFSMNLTCGLTCTAAAMGPHYGLGTIDAFFASEPATGLCINKLNDFAYDIDPTGSATLIASPPAGSRFFAKASGVTCWCGGSLARGQGGYIDAQTAIITTPPFIQVDKTATVGSDIFGSMLAAPRGAETIDFVVSGAGLSSTTTFTAADFPQTSSCPSAAPKTLRLTPTAPGTLTLTATINPGAQSSTVTIAVTGLSGTGGGSGGGSSATGGGSGGGDGSSSGCSTAPGALVWALALLWGRHSKGKAS